MRPWIRRMILAAVFGVAGGSGAVFAQAPQQMPSTRGGLPDVTAPVIATPVQAAPAPVQAAPAPVQAAPAALPVDPTAPIQVAPAAPAPYAISPAPVSSGGCCGSAAAPSYGYAESTGSRHRHGGGLFGRAAIGEGCANPIGCGNCASEKTFLFGSCSQFFNPGNDCGHGGGGFFRNLCNRDCSFAPLGTSGLSSPPCTYTSYLNR